MLLLGVALAAISALHELPDVDWRFQPAWTVVAGLSFVALLLINAELWRRLVLALGPHLAPLRATAIWCMSSLGRYVPTSLLLPVMRMAMAEADGVPKRICLASLTYELVMAFTAALVLGAYFVIDLPELQDTPSRWITVILPVIAVIVLQPRVFRPVADSVLRRLGREPLPSVLDSRRVLEFLFLYVLSLVVAGFGVYAVAKSVYPVGSDDLVRVIGAFAAAITLGLIAFVLPGGLVAREAALALALAPVMPSGPALVVAVLARIMQMAVELLLAILTPMLARARDG